MTITDGSATVELEQSKARRWWLEARASAGVIASRDWRVAGGLIALVAGWRLLILAVSWLWGRMPVATPWPPDVKGMWLWRYSIRWDAGFYLDIARHGYHYQPGYPSSVAYFPLYPLLIRFAHLVLPGSEALAALVVSQLALTGAIIYVFWIARLDFSEQIAWRSVALLLVFPSAFFFSAVYPEGLLLLGFAGSLYHARRGQWLRAGLFGIVASATKLVGVVAIVPLFVELWSQRTLSMRRPGPILSASIASLGTLTYLSYLQVRFGDFRVLFDTEGTWLRHAFQPVFLMGFRWLLGDRSAYVFYPANSTPLKAGFLLLDTTLLWVVLVAGIVCWRYLRPSYGALVLGGALVPAFSGSPAGMNRYVVVLFPVFILLGMIKSEGVRTAIMFVFIFGLAFTTWLFINELWAG